MGPRPSREGFAEPAAHEARGLSDLIILIKMQINYQSLYGAWHGEWS